MKKRLKIFEVLAKDQEFMPFRDDSQFPNLREIFLEQSMSGPAQAGLFLYAKDLGRLVAFYESILAMSRLHASEDMVVLQCQHVQFIVHRIPAHIATEIEVASAPVLREESAMNFFFTISSIEGVRQVAAELGGMILDTIHQGPGFHVCNACDPEGNIFEVRQNG